MRTIVKRLKKTKNLAEVEMITLTQSSSFLMEHRSFTCAPHLIVCGQAHRLASTLRMRSGSGSHGSSFSLFQMPLFLGNQAGGVRTLYSDRKLKYGYTSQPRSQVLFHGLERDCLRVWFLYSIALFTVNFSHFHFNVIQRGCEATSG